MLERPLLACMRLGVGGCWIPMEISFRLVLVDRQRLEGRGMLCSVPARDVGGLRGARGRMKGREGRSGLRGPDRLICLGTSRRRRRVSEGFFRRRQARSGEGEGCERRIGCEGGEVAGR